MMRTIDQNASVPIGSSCYKQISGFTGKLEIVMLSLCTFVHVLTKWEGMICLLGRKSDSCF